MNNTVSASTGKSPMQFLTGLNAPSPLEAAAVPANVATDWISRRNELRDHARHALVFAQTKMSIYYDRKHTPITFKPADLVYIRLAGSMEPGYHLPHTISSKLSQQRVGPFKVLERVGELAYKLKLPATWTIHPVLSVAHLEKHVVDTFQRSDLVVPELVVGHDGEEEEEWEVEDIVHERYNKRRKRKEYLVKWKGFGPENNTWEPESNLANAREVMDRFAGSLTTVASTFFLPSPAVKPVYNGSLVIEFD
jgi:Chromo (CHRromatin Organisation MOdifier) domain